MVATRAEHMEGHNINDGGTLAPGLSSVHYPPAITQSTVALHSVAIQGPINVSIRGTGR
jgi:hypothetical protein